MTTSQPGPWVDPDIRDREPWLGHDGIVKFLEFPVRNPLMSHRAFHLYWQRHHSAHVMHVTGFSQFMRKYNSGHVFPAATPGLPAHYRQDTAFEGASEVWINDWREVGDWLGHPLYAELIQPDELRFIAQDGRGRVMVTKEERIYEPVLDMQESGKTKLYLQMKAKPGLERDVFHRSLSAHAHAIVQRPELKRLLQKLVLSHRLRDPSPIEGMPPCDIDAVGEFWFNSRADLAGFFSHPDYEQFIRPNESHFADSASLQAIVARMRVVHDEFSFQPSTTQPLSFDWRD